MSGSSNNDGVTLMTGKITAQETKRQLALLGIETEMDFERNRLYVVSVNLPVKYLQAIDALGRLSDGVVHVE